MTRGASTKPINLGAFELLKRPLIVVWARIHRMVLVKLTKGELQWYCFRVLYCFCTALGKDLSDKGI